MKFGFELFRIAAFMATYLVMSWVLKHYTTAEIGALILAFMMFLDIKRS